MELYFFTAFVTKDPKKPKTLKNEDPIRPSQGRPAPIALHTLHISPSRALQWRVVTRAVDVPVAVPC